LFLPKEIIFVKKLLSLLVVLTFAFASITKVDASELTLCKDSPAFAKRQKTSLKKLENRLSKYDADSLPTLVLQKQISQTKERFARYGAGNLMCGTDGLPHLITDGEWSHAGEFVLPGLGFLYTAGWIGWAGRSYLGIVRKDAKSNEKEIIIDVPLASKLMLSGFTWPAQAWSELATGELLAANTDITCSPR
jgi:photosystem I subunit 3